MPIGDTTITVAGNLTADPELRFTGTGIAVTSFTVAASRRVYDQDAGQWKDSDALFLRCSAWRQLAERVTESLTKGTRVIVTGRLRQRDYETSDGQKRTVYEVDADDAGPSLRFATAKVTKATRDRPPHPAEAAGDPWASSGAADAPAAGAGGQPPF
jgi:single-strand DNA-binding protein